MAQAVRHDKVELDVSLLSRAKDKALLLQEDANDLQMTGCCVPARKLTYAYVPAGKLTYANPRCWKITEFVASLIRSHELRVSGKYFARHVVGITYEVYFEVTLKDNCDIDEVELKLTFPDGSEKTRKESLKNYAAQDEISLKVGEFSGGEIKFELKGTESETLKKDLLIFGVVVKERPLMDGYINADA